MDGLLYRSPYPGSRLGSVINVHFQFSFWG
jgi:hypothetical protein